MLWVRPIDSVNATRTETMAIDKTWDVSANPMKIGANPADDRAGSVTPMITIRNPAVSTVSQSAAAGSV